MGILSRKMAMQQNVKDDLSKVVSHKRSKTTSNTSTNMPGIKTY